PSPKLSTKPHRAGRDAPPGGSEHDKVERQSEGFHQREVIFGTPKRERTIPESIRLSAEALRWSAALVGILICGPVVAPGWVTGVIDVGCVGVSHRAIDVVVDNGQTAPRAANDHPEASV